MNTLKLTLKKKETRIFATSSYLFSWLVWLPLVLNDQFGLGLPTVKYQYFFAAFGPCFGALFTSVTVQGSYGVKSFFQRIFNPRIRPWCYVFAIGSPFLFFIVAAAVTYVFQGSFIDISRFGLTGKINSNNFLFVWMFWIVTYGFGEEVGWRGYLLPKINEVAQTATTAVVVAQFWALWHLPADPWVRLSSFPSLLSSATLRTRSAYRRKNRHGTEV